MEMFTVPCTSERRELATTIEVYDSFKMIFLALNPLSLTTTKIQENVSRHETTKGGSREKERENKESKFHNASIQGKIIEKMFRSIFGQKVFTRPRSSGGMDSSSKKSKRRSERPSSPEDLNPPTILREHGRRGERPSSSGDTNPSNMVKEHRERGEGPLSCAENQPSITRQQAWRDVSSLFIVGTNTSTDMKESRQRGESSLSSSSEEDEPSTTRQRVRRGESPSSSSSEEKQPTTPRRQQAWRVESPSSSSSEDDQRCTTRLPVQRDVSSLFIVGTNHSTVMKESRQRRESSLSSSSEEDEPSTTRQRVQRFESPSSSSSEDSQPTTRRRQQAGKGESPSSSSSEDDQRCTTRLLVRRLESPSSSSSEDSQPTTRRRQQARRAESTLSSSSEDDQPSTTRRQQQRSPLSFVDINLPTTFRQNGGIGENHLPCVDIDQPTIWWEHVRRGERPLFRGDLNPSDTLRQDGRSGDSPSSTSSSSEDDEPSTTRRQQERRDNSHLSIYLSARREREIIEREKQRLEEEGLKRERERCEEMKRKNQEKERKTFGLRSRIYIWWLNRKIKRIARDIQSTFVDERYLLRHDPLRNPEKMAEKERLLDRRRELVLYKRRQKFKVEREMMKQKLKVERKEINAKKMENISELCHNSESMLNLRNGPMPVRSRKLVLVNIYQLR
ncbi:adenomatous polyposis coli homolog isoform X2 [Perca flavescens]|uniref:adenomatous polyposis coli homolog isoform X2 n=1 Tax=Perca flavescens TaxID=8167 RepID=UPI00106E0EE0|nr:adenomatous polyposis coli homolog isoform X2 [Perca flavescens]